MKYSFGDIFTKDNYYFAVIDVDDTGYTKYRLIRIHDLFEIRAFIGDMSYFTLIGHDEEIAKCIKNYVVAKQTWADKGREFTDRLRVINGQYDTLRQGDVILVNAVEVRNGKEVLSDKSEKYIIIAKYEEDSKRFIECVGMTSVDIVATINMSRNDFRVRNIGRNEVLLDKIIMERLRRHNTDKELNEELDRHSLETRRVILRNI